MSILSCEKSFFDITRMDKYLVHGSKAISNISFVIGDRTPPSSLCVTIDIIDEFVFKSSSMSLSLIRIIDSAGKLLFQ